MKTLRYTVIALSLLLLVSGQGVWAVAPGSGHSGNRSDKNVHRPEKPAIESMDAASMSVPGVDEDLITKPDEVKKTNSTTVKSRSSKTSTSKGKKSGPAPEAESSVRKDAQQEDDVKARQTTIVGGAVNHLLSLLTTIDRDELPVSDSTVAFLLIFLFCVPPLTVLASTRELKSEFWFNLLLTSFFWVPGLVHATIVVQRNNS